jgi:UTP--glucose-1-phosphate uridylyltransferase
MKAIIPAAGYGTRMLPITKTIPKEMLPVGNKPVIQYIVEWLVSAGITEIAMITSQGKMPLEYYFDKNYELEEQLRIKNKQDLLNQINAPKTMANYVFLKQKEQLWLPHAIREARYRMDDDFFFVTVWDQFGEQAIYRDMVDMFRQTRQPIVQLTEVPLEEVSKYGVVKIVDGEIVDMIEKPKPEYAPSRLISQWLYILPKDFFKAVEETPMDETKGEIIMPDVLLTLRKMWYKLMPYVSNHIMRDVGSTELWLETNNELAKRWWKC